MAKRNNAQPPAGSPIASILGNLGKSPVVKPQPAPEDVITVKTLADHFDLEPIVIRKILRSIGIKPSKVAVPNGWKNQTRNQYIWTNNQDPELVRVVAEIQKKIAE